MDKGNLFYFALMAIVIIVSIIQKINKSKKMLDAEQQQEQPEPTPLDPWREIMREMAGYEQEKPVSSHKFEPSMDEALQSQETETNTEIFDDLSTEELKTNPIAKNQDTKTATPFKHTNNERIRLDAQEIRKAVIYNEILKRKYC